MPFIRDTFNNSLFRWFGGGVGGVVTIFLLGKNFFDLSPLDSAILGAGVFLGIVLIRLFYLVFVEVFVDSIYGNAIIQLKDAYAEINRLKRINTGDKKEIMEAITTMCNLLKVVFDKKTRSECSISIKVPILDCPISPDSELKNICRDYKHKLIRDTDIYKSQKHTVIGNTAFQVIVSNVLKSERAQFFYLNNNIKKTKHYHNTSKPAYPDGKLPYKSELVFPIIPLLPLNTKATEEKIQIWGFLCIDSNRKNSFNNRYDVAIVEGVADVIFDVIMKVNKLKTENHANETQTFSK